MLESTNLLWYSSIAVQLLFCLHLIWSKLARSYLVFTAYLGYSVLRDLAAIYFMRGAVGPRLPLAYTYFWLWTEPLSLLLQMALAWEVHKKLWVDHKGVLRQTRPLLIFALITAVTAAAIPVRAEANHTQATALLLLRHFAIQTTRYISTVLAVFLVLSAILFFVVIGNGLKNNVFRHEGMLAAFFGIYAIAAFVISSGLALADFVNGYFVSAITLCFIAWFSAFRPLPLPRE